MKISGCIVITGNEKALRCGADINFMKDLTTCAYKTDFITRTIWERIKTTRKPADCCSGWFLPWVAVVKWR